MEIKVIDNTFSYEIMEDYIHFILKGERNYDNVIRWWSEMASIIKNLNIKKILVEDILPGHLSSKEILEIVSELEYMGFKEIKIAYYETNIEDDITIKYAHMIANVSQFNSAIFSNKKAAINWLKGNI